MWRFRHALLSAGPNQDSGKGSDIGVRAILKGEAQVDQRPLAAPESRPDIPETLVQDAAGGASSLGSRSHGSFQVRRTWYGACRSLQGPQQPAEYWWPGFPLIAAQSPHDGRPSVTPTRHPMSPQIGTPSRRQKPGDRGAGALRSHPERSTALACQLLIPARASRLSRWSRHGAAMRAAMPSSTVVFDVPHVIF